MSAGPAAPQSGARLRDEFTNLPNLLTLMRIALVPAILGLMDNYSAVRSYLACLLYIVAAVTDLLDGWLARRRRQVSILGQFLDPLADKLLVTGVLVYMAAMGRCEAWLVVALLARELLIQGLRSIASSEGLVMAASQQGKQKTALQMVGTMFLLIHFRYPVLGLHREVDFHDVGIWVLRGALVVSVVSAIGYVRLFAHTVYGAARDSG